MSSNLWVKNGTYDPSKRFEFTNIDTEPFSFAWGGTPITVKPGEKVILRHHLAVLAATKLVDKLMLDDIKRKLDVEKAKNANYLAPNQAGSLGVPAARAPWEEKVLKELAPMASNDAQLGIIRTEFTEQLMNDINAKPSPSVSKISEVGITGVKEFEDVNLPSSGN